MRSGGEEKKKHKISKMRVQQLTGWCSARVWCVCRSWRSRVRHGTAIASHPPEDQHPTEWKALLFFFSFYPASEDGEQSSSIPRRLKRTSRLGCSVLIWHRRSANGHQTLLAGKLGSYATNQIPLTVKLCQSFADVVCIGKNDSIIIS